MEGNDQSRALFHTPGDLSVPLRGTIGAAVATDPGGDYVLGCLLDPAPGGVPVFYDDPGDMLSAFVCRQHRGKELLLHGADQDMRYFLPRLEQMVSTGDYTASFIVNAQAHIMHVKISRGHTSWYVRDTFGLLPLPLGDLAQLANYTGEYQPLPPDPFDLDIDVRAYLARDARLILRAYRAFADTIKNTFGVRPAMTAGSTAMRAFRTTIPDGHVYYRSARPVEAFARAGYFGALNFLTTPNPQTNVSYIDINAMYAQAMRMGVPVMGAWQTDVEEPGYPGIYECVVTPPDNLFIPIVPYRDPDTYTVQYPRRGVFTSIVCSHTIELARQLGYKIDVSFGYAWEKIDYPFSDFVDKCETLEHEYRGKGARVVIKQIRNSIYGKFGQKETGREYYLTSETDPDGWTPVIRSIDGREIDNFFMREVDIQRAHMMPHWAAWITATARNTLARAAYALPREAVFYGDTDSLILDRGALDLAVSGGVLDLGARYGQWKVSAEYERIEIWGKKRYRGVMATGEIKEYDLKWAGVPKGILTASVLSQIIPGGPPTPTPEYRRNFRAVDTVGGRAQSDYIVQQIYVPELNTAPWQQEDW